MARRPTIRKTDIDTAADALLARGFKLTAFDILPSGGVRFYFETPPDSDGDDLDRELARFEAKHNGED